MGCDMGRIYDATWGRGFTAIYDRGIKATEEAGLREMRRELLTGASGHTVEIGAGTGANLDLYPEAVTELVLVEPDPHMSSSFAPKLEQDAAASVDVAEAPGRAPSLARISSFDTAVFTLVLCTVPDPAAALAEVARVLKPGRAAAVHRARPLRGRRPGPLAGPLEKPWRFLGDGCHCNRDTVATIAGSRFELSAVERGRLPKAPPIVRPLVRGSAVRPELA